MTLLNLCKEFEELQNKLSNFGAADTEPNYHFMHSLRKKINDNEDYIPSNADEWELYTSMEGSEEAAEKMTSALKNLLNKIDNGLHKEVLEVKNYYGLDC